MSEGGGDDGWREINMKLLEAVEESGQVVTRISTIGNHLAGAGVLATRARSPQAQEKKGTYGREGAIAKAKKKGPRTLPLAPAITALRSQCPKRGEGGTGRARPI